MRRRDCKRWMHQPRGLKTYVRWQPRCGSWLACVDITRIYSDATTLEKTSTTSRIIHPLLQQQRWQQQRVAFGAAAATTDEADEEGVSWNYEIAWWYIGRLARQTISRYHLFRHCCSCPCCCPLLLPPAASPCCCPLLLPPAAAPWCRPLLLPPADASTVAPAAAPVAVPAALLLRPLLLPPALGSIVPFAILVSFCTLLPSSTVLRVSHDVNDSSIPRDCGHVIVFLFIFLPLRLSNCKMRVGLFHRWRAALQIPLHSIEPQFLQILFYIHTPAILAHARA